MTDLRVHDPDLGVHHADPGVHHGPIPVFTFGRSERSRWADARNPVAHREAFRLLAQPRARQQGLWGQAAQRPDQTLASRVAAALRLAASSLYHSRSALGAFHRRLKARLGAPKAITATAHKLARLIYRMLRFGTEYVDRGQDYYERRCHGRWGKS
jgi:hypothetical protein